MGEVCVAHGGGINTQRKFVRDPETTRPLERPKSRYNDNIKIDLKRMKFESFDWIHLTSVALKKDSPSSLA